MNTIANFTAQQLGCIRNGKTLFADLSFSLTAGSALIIEGANGAGKSSLLRMLAGLAIPPAGQVSFDNHDVHAALAEYAEHMHYVGHTNGIRPGLTVKENLQLACELSQQQSEMDEILSLLKLDTYKNTQTQFLSAGQKRRVALARLFIMPRALWILDEPFTALDTDIQQILLDRINAHLRNGGICVLSSHQPVDLEHPAQRLRLAA